MLTISKARKIFSNVNGGSFIGIDTVTEVPLPKTLPSATIGKTRDENPYAGEIFKRHTGANVMVFQNNNTNAYDAMVKRRLEEEGKDPNNFKLQPRKWGKRIPGTPFIEHVKDGKTHYYLEVIFLRAGETTYLHGVRPIKKSEIYGLKEPKEGNQGGLDDKVIIRTYSFKSIRAIRIDGTEYKF